MTRVVSGVILAAIALAAIRFLPDAVLRVVVAPAVAALAAREYLTIVGMSRGADAWLLVAASALACWWMPSARAIHPAPVTLAAVAWLALETLVVKRTLQEAAAGLVAPLYVGLSLGMLVALHLTYGWRVTLLLVGTVIVSDSGQYYSGRAFGRRPLAPTISPKKTVEGAVGGVVFGTLFMVAAGGWALPGTGAPRLAVLGAIVVVLGIAGDLFESRLKRVAGLKDSSALIPGHGGVLDRIDALLFAAPAFYVALSRG